MTGHHLPTSASTVRARTLVVQGDRNRFVPVEIAVDTYRCGTQRYGLPVAGAMDLAVDAKQVFVLMRHTTPDGSPKILPACTHPLIGTAVVSRICTDLPVPEITPEGVRVVELHAGNPLDEVQTCTGVVLLAPVGT